MSDNSLSSLQDELNELFDGNVYSDKLHSNSKFLNKNTNKYINQLNDCIQKINNVTNNINTNNTASDDDYFEKFGSWLVNPMTQILNDTKTEITRSKDNLTKIYTKIDELLNALNSFTITVDNNKLKYGLHGLAKNITNKHKQTFLLNARNDEERATINHLLSQPYQKRGGKKTRKNKVRKHKKSRKH